MKNHKFALMAILGIALAFTFSCSLPDDNGGNETSYDWCITANNTCLAGPHTTSTCNGQLSNSCPNPSGSSPSSSPSVGGSSSSSSGGGTPTTPIYSLDGIWESESGALTTISGSSGVRSSFGPSALTQDAINKGYYTLGQQIYRNLKSTGTLTWSGQHWMVYYNDNNPNVALGVDWFNCTITISTDGQTITFVSEAKTIGDLTVRGSTWTLTRKSTYSLDGIWESESGALTTISGSSGVRSSFGPSALTQDAINKGYYTLGQQTYRNLKSTGTLTWSGQHWMVYYNDNNPNVARGVDWFNCTSTISTDGQTITFVSEAKTIGDLTVRGSTWTLTRKQ